MIVTQVAFTVAILLGAIAGMWEWMKADSTELGFPAPQYLSARIEVDHDAAASDSAVEADFLTRCQTTLGVLVGTLLYVALMLAGAGTAATVGGEVGLLLKVAAVVMVVGILACGIPAMRALRVEPTIALKDMG